MSNVSRKLEIIPLGGVGQFGMNMMAMRYGGETIIIDAGMSFPEEDQPGVDIIIPDFSFISQYRDEISAVVLTQGQQEHNRGSPSSPQTISIPVYRITLE